MDKRELSVRLTTKKQRKEEPRHRTADYRKLIKFCSARKSHYLIW